MGKRKPKILFAVVIGIFVITAFFVVFSPEREVRPHVATNQHSQKTEVKYSGIEGKNALELLKSHYKTETTSYNGLGELVTGIDGRIADKQHFWAFYVNAQQSQVGAGEYITKASDTVTWRLEEIN